MAGSTRGGAPARSCPHPSGLPRRPGGTLRVSAARHLPPDRRTAEGGPGPRGRGCELRSEDPDLPPERVATIENRDVGADRAPVAPARGDLTAVRVRGARATGTPAVPVAAHSAGSYAHRLPEAARCGGRAGRLETGRDPLEDVPAQPLRRAPPDP